MEMFALLMKNVILISPLALEQIKKPVIVHLVRSLFLTDA
jgi:hypothetical protein